MPVRRSKIKYEQLSKAKIQPQRNLVISSCSKGGFTLAQQLDVEENGRKTSVFLSGAFIIDSIESLYNLRDAINVAINMSQNTTGKISNDSENDDWDA